MTDAESVEREADRLAEEFGPFETPEDMIATADRLAEAASSKSDQTGLERAAIELLQKRARQQVG